MFFVYFDFFCNLCSDVANLSTRWYQKHCFKVSLHKIESTSANGVFTDHYLETRAGNTSAAMKPGQPRVLCPPARSAVSVGW